MSERREKMVSTGETDLSLARVIAAKKNEQLFTRKRYPELQENPEVPFPLTPLIEDFLAYLADLGRSYDHVKNLNGRLGYLTDWMKKRGLINIQDMTAHVLRDFQRHLRDERKILTSNWY